MSEVKRKEEGILEEMQKEESVSSIRFNKVISTGSTLLDLAISGGRVKGGGVPAGIHMEISGPESSGKSLLLIEIAGSIMNNGGDIFFDDTEGRLDKEYSSILGVSLPENKFTVSQTIEELTSNVMNWIPEPEKKGAISGYIVDSIAALSSDWELKERDANMAPAIRAKMFHALFRKVKPRLEDNNAIMVFSNQEQDSIGGMGNEKNTPGGRGVRFWSSIRMRIAPFASGKYIKKKVKFGKKDSEEVVGIRSLVKIKKNSCDNGYREAPVTILYGYGIDDISENLRYVKEAEGETTYICPDGQGFRALEEAAIHIENNNLEEKLRIQVIDLWESFQEQIKPNRVQKKRV